MIENNLTIDPKERVMALLELLSESRSRYNRSESSEHTELDTDQLRSKINKIGDKRTLDALLLVARSGCSIDVLDERVQWILKSIWKSSPTRKDLCQFEDDFNSIDNILDVLEQTEIIYSTEDGYDILNPSIRLYVQTLVEDDTYLRSYTNGIDRIITSKSDTINVRKTAFSAFSSYDIEFTSDKSYYCVGKNEIDKASILVHSLVVAENPEERSLAMLFNLDQGSELRNSNVVNVAKNWNCVDLWDDCRNFLRQQQCISLHDFPDWDEFIDHADSFGITIPGAYTKRAIEENFSRLGNQFKEPIRVYVVGGSNLALRGMVETTGDVDVIVEGKDVFNTIEQVLTSCEYSNKSESLSNYQDHMLFENEKEIDWHVMVNTFVGPLTLSEGMKNRAKFYSNYGQLFVYLLAPSDLYLSLGIATREKDFPRLETLSSCGGIDLDIVRNEIDDQIETVTVSFDDIPKFDLIQSENN